MSKKEAFLLSILIFTVDYILAIFVLKYPTTSLHNSLLFSIVIGILLSFSFFISICNVIKKHFNNFLNKSMGYLKFSIIAMMLLIVVIIIEIIAVKIMF
ncbi:hypothetical protein DY124_07060 [Apilactobacillus micheneri]|uniref:hypothetical protein n=1 Tax=Apilactobacillus micheneri TaxID=1899430 RepID=UPI00112C3ECB|nr:hypothetical protein [Apilactobacillus micheneri]TPR42820.1 hypothetical protein DY124_07060 [Apilactobacillus micheneri]TPR47144.1 hypothetical protein DY125_06990 [Apilactobacillus micheneri]